MTRKLTCIICPRGCALTVNLKNDPITVDGASCARGIDYAIGECTHPVRTVTSTVTVENRDMPASVKTLDPIPKEHIFDAMEVIRQIHVKPPVAIGDVVCDDLFGTKLIVTKAVD